MSRDRELGDLDERELLETVVLELRALRRLIGTAFVVAVVLVLVGPGLVVLAG